MAKYRIKWLENDSIVTKDVNSWDEAVKYSNGLNNLDISNFIEEI